MSEVAMHLHQETAHNYRCIDDDVPDILEVVGAAEVAIKEDIKDTTAKYLDPSRANFYTQGRERKS
jgi:hypothetical protein